MKTPTPLQFVLLDLPDHDAPAEVAIIQGRSSCHYYVSLLPHEWGEGAYRFVKVYRDDGSDPTESQYDVMIAGDESACSCKGFQRHEGTKVCDKCGGHGRRGKASDIHGEVCPWCGGAGLFCCKHIKCARWIIDQNLDLPLWRDWPDLLPKVAMPQKELT